MYQLIGTLCSKDVCEPKKTNILLSQMHTVNSDLKQHFKDFRLLLQQELIERCRRNPKYSLRAFARALGIGPSALSDMLNGKRAITKASIERLGLALGLNLSELSQYTNNINKNQLSSLAFEQITLDTFAIISDWYHYAILELMKVKNFKNDLAWLTKSLGITKSEANAAVERLLRVGLIKVDKKGKWIDSSSGFSTNIAGSSITSAANKKLQKQVLEKSLWALETLPPSVRNHTSMTMPINPNKLPEAIERIKEFRREMCQFLENDSNLLEVYNLAISLYPISNCNSGEKL